ncbi:hypothetical protein JBL43_19670 [Aureibaculum sp. A20]|uniref:SMODS-associating 2TM beta-strand rich effector domain-containing protein n=1 Tax=Aureibaculum flavum TaxID=2795986 RepID=A0ABS0WWU8_9FLAO|nr:hypothetical protein [Aureibaculum flavum]MBJ2176479.1 hypothetical protein [Aureibaculum flavum]
MDYIIIILLGILIIGPIAYGYYLDYKSNPKEFTASLKPILVQGFIFCLIYFGTNKIYELIIPLNKNHGIEFNYEREKLGIPELGTDWKIDNHSEQFETQWWKPNPRNGHFKKIIEYGILNVKSETDYYQNEKIKGTFAWSKFVFNENTFYYYLEKPNEKEISITEKGKIKHEKPIVVVTINKLEFEKYIAE